MFGEQVSVEHDASGTRVCFTTRATGIRAWLASLGELLYAVPLSGGLMVFALLSALYDGAGIGPDLIGRLVITGAIGLALYAVVALPLREDQHGHTVQIDVQRGMLKLRIGPRQIEVPLDQVRVHLANGVLTVSHPADTELIHPLQPEAVRPFVDRVHALQAAHGDRSQVPEALQKRPDLQ